MFLRQAVICKAASDKTAWESIRRKIHKRSAPVVPELHPAMKTLRVSAIWTLSYSGGQNW